MHLEVKENNRADKCKKPLKIRTRVPTNIIFKARLRSSYIRTYSIHMHQTVPNTTRQTIGIRIVWVIEVFWHFYEASLSTDENSATASSHLVCRGGKTK